MRDGPGKRLRGGEMTLAKGDAWGPGRSGDVIHHVGLPSVGGAKGSRPSWCNSPTKSLLRHHSTIIPWSNR